MQVNDFVEYFVSVVSVLSIVFLYIYIDNMYINNECLRKKEKSIIIIQ